MRDQQAYSAQQIRTGTLYRIPPERSTGAQYRARIVLHHCTDLHPHRTKLVHEYADQSEASKVQTLVVDVTC